METDQIQEWVRQVSSDYIEDVASSVGSGSDHEDSDEEQGSPVSIIKRRKTVKLEYRPDDEPIGRYLLAPGIMQPSFKKLAPIPHREESMRWKMDVVEKKIDWRGDDTLPADFEDTADRLFDAESRIKIAPQSMVERLKETWNGRRAHLLDDASYDTNIWVTAVNASAPNEITWDVEHEFQTLKQITDRIKHCSLWDLSAVAWNTKVWDPLLEIALAPFGRAVSHWDASEARIAKAYIPQTFSGERVEPRPITFCITLDGKQVDEAVRDRLFLGATGTINHTWYAPFRQRPIAISITMTTGDKFEARLHILAWAAAHFARLRELSATSSSANCASIALPILVISEDTWIVCVVTDCERKVSLSEGIHFQNNNSIVDCYKKVALVRWLVVWSLTKFRDWLAEHALYTLDDDVIVDDNAEDDENENEDEEMDDYESD